MIQQSMTRRYVAFVGLLSIVSLVGYALRSNIAVAQELMAPSLGLSMMQMGTITAWGFQLAYAFFQIPMGLLGDRYGARTVLGLAILGWAGASFATGFVPSGEMSALLALFFVRSILGVCQAATYPVASMAITQTLPVGLQTTANSFYISAALLGSAITPLVFVPLMLNHGWRAVFMVSGAAGLVTAILWFLLAPRTGRADSERLPLICHFRSAAALLRDRNLLILSTSYLLHSAVFFVFVFWFFRYLVDARGFTILESGTWSSVPYFVGFALAPLAGFLSDQLGRRSGRVGEARRRVTIGCLCIAAAAVALGVNLDEPVTAIIALSLAVASLNAAEGPFWATATHLGSSRPGTAGGIFNLMGNLGGVLSIWLVPLMKESMDWVTLMIVWAVVLLVAASLWMAVRVD